MQLKSADDALWFLELIAHDIVWNNTGSDRDSIMIEHNSHSALKSVIDLY